MEQMSQQRGRADEISGRVVEDVMVAASEGWATVVPKGAMLRKDENSFMQFGP